MTGTAGHPLHCVELTSAVLHWYDLVSERVDPDDAALIGAIETYLAALTGVPHD